MDKINVSIDEFISTINHSNLPTVIIEGEFDAVIYRILEEIHYDKSLSVMPVGGRPKVLELYARRAEIKRPNKVVFIADKDLFVISGIPDVYKDDCIIFTNGYSIENDLFVDGNLEGILSAAEMKKYKVELEKIVKWFSLVACRCTQGNLEKMDHHPNHVLDNWGDLCALKEGEEYPEEFYLEVMKDYKCKLRGKTLVNALMRHLSYKGRAVKHRSDALMETVARSDHHPLLDSIFFSVAAKLA